MNSAQNGATASTVSSFSDFELHVDLMKTVQQAGFKVPTPIQAAAIPKALMGRDLIGLAQTGTGKTAAFVLPILQSLLSSTKKGVRALVIAPTRELVDQINEVFQTLSRGTGLRSTTIYGGVSYGRQLDELRRQPQIVIACPGRLLDHLANRAIDLSRIEVLVLDEADRMFDMGFLPTIRRIVKVLPKERQTLLFSATMPSEIEQLARELLQSPEVVRVKSDVPVAKITHGVYTVGEGAKQDLLNSWLGENQDSLVVVFTRMKHTAKRIHLRLEAAGHKATSLHGNLSQGKRQQALGGFRSGQYRILVATDIAARGIDVEGVSHVINYDMPENLESYIHRVGRAGRASRSGAAVSFITREDRTLQKSIERWLQGPMHHLGSAEAKEDPRSRDTRPAPRNGGTSRSSQRPGQRSSAAWRDSSHGSSPRGHSSRSHASERGSSRGNDFNGNGGGFGTVRSDSARSESAGFRRSGNEGEASGGGNRAPASRGRSFQRGRGQFTGRRAGR